MNISKPITKLQAYDLKGNLLTNTKFSFANKVDTKNFYLTEDANGTFLYTKKAHKEKLLKLQLFGYTQGRYSTRMDYVNIFIIYFYTF